MKKSRPIQLYNTPEEIGVRLMIILSSSQASMSLERLQIYDHLVLHISDISKEHVSIHPSNPSYSSELAAKRDLIHRSLSFLVLRGLISVKCTSRGIQYASNKTTEKSLSTLTSKYAKQIEGNSKIVCNLLGSYNDLRLQKHIYMSMGDWAGEIEQDYTRRRGAQ